MKSKVRHVNTAIPVMLLAHAFSKIECSHVLKDAWPL